MASSSTQSPAKRQRTGTSSLRSKVENFNWSEIIDGWFVGMNHPSDRSASAKLVAENLRLMTSIFLFQNIAKMPSAHIHKSVRSVACNAVDTSATKKIVCKCESHTSLVNSAHSHEYSVYCIKTTVQFSEKDIRTHLLDLGTNVDLLSFTDDIIPTVIDADSYHTPKTCIHFRILTMNSINFVTRKSLATSKTDNFYEIIFSFYHTERREIRKIRNMADNAKKYLELIVFGIKARMCAFSSSFTLPLLSITEEEREEMINKYMVLRS